MREAEAPLRRENLMLKQQLSAQPPHSRLSGDGVSSMELPSVRQLLDDLVSEQGRLTQLHQTAIERQIQLLHHPQSSHASSSSSAAAAANPPNHTTAPSVPLSLSMDDANASPAAAAAGGSSSAQRNAPCAASSSSSGGGGGGSSAARCSVCLVNPTNVILLPCGHKVVCQDCFEKWMAPMPTEDKLCPEHTCRQPYSEVRYIKLCVRSVSRSGWPPCRPKTNSAPNTRVGSPIPRSDTFLVSE
uniref:RING-type domain-containing protein n=1 Tax=Vitrella brassicaformis TaxID=1169539 RepID=A0A7S1JT13_9ALVE